MSLFYCDLPITNFRMQDSATYLSYSLHDLQDKLNFIVVLLVVMVTWLLLSGILCKDYTPRIYVNDFLEFVWTIFPMLILWIIAIQSVDLMYCMDEVYDPEMTLAVTGYQWYWVYQYSDYDVDPVESRILSLPDLVNKLSKFRDNSGDYTDHKFNLLSLEVDNCVYLPVNTNVRVLVTSADVIHSWAVPSFGIKVDAIPGRINSTGIHVHRLGTYYGQCSELCGAMHGFMPIKVCVVEPEQFLNLIA